MKNLINKSDLISKIQTLAGLTNAERSSLIGLLREHKKYGLVWEDKPEDVEERLRDSLPVLREVKDKALLSSEPDAPNHILIEGDNLEALTALSYTHEGKIDVIYIDPPYNTGNKDFVYNDSFVDSEDSYRHSKWLSFMSKRLKIAKKLLSDKGVIFISIDDNEQAQLKLLCDEVFSSSHFRNILFVRRRTKTLNLQFAYNGLNTQNVGAEYILVYANDGFLFREMRVKKKDAPEKGTWNVFWSNADRPTMRYELLGFTPSTGQWRWAKELAEEAVENYKEYLHTARYLTLEEYWNQTGRKKRFIRRITNGTGKNGGVQYWVGPSDTFLRTTNWTDIEVSQIHKDFDLPFDNPKNVELIREILTAPFHYTNTILDFFAGSGTTLHATMQLNAEDGGHRQCILVTNNENNICEEVTYERNKRVINGYTTPKGVEVEGLKANTLRYYKTDYISRDRTQKNMRDLVAAATDLLCIKEDLYEEQKTFGRFKLKPQLARYFHDGRKHMLIIYREELIDEIAEEIKNLDFGGKRLKIYVFSPGRYAFTDNFREVEDKVELVALPAAIYDAYQKVLPKQKEKLFEEERKQQKTKIPVDLFFAERSDLEVEREGQGE